MKEVFRHADSALVGLYQSILDDAEIPTFVANARTQQSLVGGLLVAFFPLPIFFPTLYVLNDDDYSEAMNILLSIREADTGVEKEEWTCGQCGETVPGNFSTCWNCNHSRSEE